MFLKNDIYFYVFLIGLLSSIVFPPIPIGGGYEVYIVTFFSVFLIIPTFFILFSMGVVNKASAYVFSLGLMVIISSIYSISIGFVGFNSRDFIESIKYFQYFPYALIALFLRFNLKAVEVFVFCAGCIFLFVGLVQILDVPFLNNFLLNLYLGKDSSHLERALTGDRITITGSDPNVGAVICAFFSFYFLYSFFYERKFSYLPLGFFASFLLLFTQSRTVILAFFLSLFLWLIFFSKARTIFKFFLFFSSLAFVCFFVFYLDLNYVILGFSMAMSGENNSLNVRLDNLYNAFDIFRLSPIFGVGPAKNILSTVIDSEYALIMQRYGFLGFLLFFGYIFYLYRLSKRNLNNKWGGILFSFVFLSLIVMATNNIFSGYQIMSILVLLNSICYWMLSYRFKQC